MTHTLGELAGFLGGELQGPADLAIEGIAALDQATPREIYLYHPEAVRPPGGSEPGRGFYRIPGIRRAGAAPDHRAPPLSGLCPGGGPLCPHPCGAGPVSAIWPIWAREWRWAGRSPSPPWSLSAPASDLGDRVTVMPGCVIGDEVRIGADTLIYPNVTIQRAVHGGSSGASSTAAR